jgi:hypothetical protein
MKTVVTHSADRTRSSSKHANPQQQPQGGGLGACITQPPISPSHLTDSTAQPTPAMPMKTHGVTQVHDAGV